MITATPSLDLAAAAPIAMFHTDVDGMCEYTNARWHELTGLSLDESLGDGWVRAIHPDDRVETFARWTAAVHDAHRDLDLAFRIIRRDGEVRVVRSRAGRFDGGWVGVVEDITEQHRMQERLSHELRTPLTSIQGALGLLGSGVMGALNAEAGELVEIAERNTARLLGVINDILD